MDESPTNKLEEEFGSKSFENFENIYAVESIKSFKS
jgi:hypothetical protein